MWQHDMSITFSADHGLKLGKLWIWYDSQWTHNGVVGEIRFFFVRLFRNANHMKRLSAKFGVIKINAKHMWRDWIGSKKSIKWLLSLRTYLRLSKAGFRISNSCDPSGNFEINRFWWKDQIIREMPDIDRSGEHYNTINNGHVESLS